MTSRTTTKVTHYHVQKKRRAEFIDEWRSYRQSGFNISKGQWVDLTMLLKPE